VDPVDNPDPLPEDEDPVTAALRAAQKITRTRPVRIRARRRRRDASATESRGYTGPGPEAGDPQRVGDVIADYSGDLGWDRPLAEARVFAEWAGIVGAGVAAHCEPTGLRAGELRIAAESTAWATQLRMLAGTLLARIVAELGPDVVTRVVVTGPVAPSWKHGRRSVHGSRGPRDTYG
jgi:predicted nucleic acid-binding Zn ribbon protein